MPISITRCVRVGADWRQYGPGINTAAVLLSSYGNVPAERTANLIGMLLGVPVSPGFVDGSSERLSSRLEDAGLDHATQTALATEPVLAADQTPVNLLDPHAGLTEDEAGTPHRGLTWLRALGSWQAAAITAVLAFFTGFLISDGYSAYPSSSRSSRASSNAASTSSADVARSPISVPAACNRGAPT